MQTPIPYKCESCGSNQNFSGPNDIYGIHIESGEASVTCKNCGKLNGFELSQYPRGWLEHHVNNNPEYYGGVRGHTLDFTKWREKQTYEKYGCLYPNLTPKNTTTTEQPPMIFWMIVIAFVYFGLYFITGVDPLVSIQYIFFQ